MGDPAADRFPRPRDDDWEPARIDPTGVPGIVLYGDAVEGGAMAWTVVHETSRAALTYASQGGTVSAGATLVKDFALGVADILGEVRYGNRKAPWLAPVKRIMRSPTFFVPVWNVNGYICLTAGPPVEQQKAAVERVRELWNRLRTGARA